MESYTSSPPQQLLIQVPLSSSSIQSNFWSFHNNFPLVLRYLIHISLICLSQLAHKIVKAIPSNCYAIYIYLGFESWTSRIHYRHFATAMIQRNPAFSTLNSDDVNYFKGILGEKNVIEDEDALLFANTDWMRKYKGSSKLLLQPGTTQEVLYISFIN